MMSACEVHEYDLRRYRAERDVAILELKAEVARHHLTVVQIDDARRAAEAKARARALEDAHLLLQDAVSLEDAKRALEAVVMEAQRRAQP